MKITTAEIKNLLKECLAKEGMYTIPDFCKFISERSAKTFTKSQISGAINQLNETGDLIRVERGLYKGKIEMPDDTGKEKHIQTQYISDTLKCLEEIENGIENQINSKKVTQLEDMEFELLTEMIKLKKLIKWIHNKFEK